MDIRISDLFRASDFEFRIFFLLCAFSSLLPLSYAAVPSQNELQTEQETPPVTTVVSAARREMPVEESTRFVTVITRKEIEQSGKAYVIDLLRAQPGVHVVQQGPSGRTSSVFLRGMNPAMTLVMLDNVQINSPTTGTANVENISTADIERIEIIRGPQSVLYGADAMGGVINIITKPDRKRGLHGDAHFEYGTHETFKEGVGLAGGWDRFSFSGAGTRFDSEGPGQNDGYQNTTARMHTKIQITKNSDLDTAFHYSNAEVGIDDGAFLQDPNNSSRTQEQTVNNRYTISLFDRWQQHVQYSFFHNALLSFDPRNPGATGADPESRFKLDTDRHTFEYQSSFFIEDFDVFTLGYEFEHTNANVKRSQASGGFERLARNHAWFLQNELTLWEIWDIVAGIRLDHYDFYGTEADPLVSTGLWIEQTQTRIKSSFGRAIKAPTFNDLFFPGFGNTDLGVEKSWGGDAGFEQFYWDKKGSLSAAYFHNQIDNLIQFIRVNGVTLPQNVAKARTQGVELQHKIKIFEGQKVPGTQGPWYHRPFGGSLNFYTNYTYTNAFDRQTEKRLVRRPWHEGKIGFTYDYQRLHFAAGWALVGTSEDTGTGPRVKNDGYTRLDIGLFYDVTKYLQIYTQADNATNDHYMEALGFENPSTRFTVGTKGKF